ncbi:MAG: aminoacyl-tRNA hydrolase [Gammaproteobacteria bacterium]|nr:aminoacyl-tRNA hydrolase [Gammaproteobacteria bacterium]
MSHAIKLIVGLGNPGPQYETTRHNAGAWFVAALAKKESLTLKKENKFLADTAKWQTPSGTCYLAIPHTFMNLSGQAVYALAHFYRLKPSEILIAHDELDLPAGTTRLKFDGGHGGHNGLRDIAQQLGSTQLYRLRIGIGHPGHRDHVTHYVLSRPCAEDQKKIEDAIQVSLDILPYLIAGDMEKAMRILHTQD